jgi:hypothetical protein
MSVGRGSFADAVADGGDFQLGIDAGFDASQFAFALQKIEKLRESRSAHGAMVKRLAPADKCWNGSRRGDGSTKAAL